MNACALVSLLAPAALVLCAPTLASSGDRQYHLTAQVNAVAASVIATATDLSLAGFRLATAWKGGAVRPDRPPALSYPGFAPNESDIVVRGLAKSDFERSIGS